MPSTGEGGKEEEEDGLVAGSGAVVVAVLGDVEVVLGRYRGPRAGIGVVDGLARLQLATRRLGGRIELRDASQDLSELIDLTGLTGVLFGLADLPVEAVGEPGGGEELGIQEVVDPRDPAP